MKTARRKSGGRKILTQRELAKLLGRSQKTISILSRRPDWPCPNGATLQDVPRLKKWLATLQPDRFAESIAEAGQAGDDGDEKRTARQRWELARATKLERENAVAENRLHEVETCSETHLSAIAAARSRLLQIPGGLSARLAGATEPVIRDLLTREIDQALTDLSEEKLRPFRHSPKRTQRLGPTRTTKAK